MNIEDETTEGTETVVVEEQAPKAKAKRSRKKAEPLKDTEENRAAHTAKSADPNESKQDKLLRLAEEKSSEDLKNRKAGKVSVSSETKKQKSKSKSKKAEKKPKKAAKAKAPKKSKKAAKPSELGLTKAGTPRLKAEFDPETTLGQKGAKLKLERDELNENEQEVLTAIKQARGPVKLTVLAEKCFPVNLGKAKRNSRVRNALRRLIRASFVKKVGRGEFEAKTAKKAA